jgi:hypothetical protein
MTSVEELLDEINQRLESHKKYLEEIIGVLKKNDCSSGNAPQDITSLAEREKYITYQYDDIYEKYRWIKAYLRCKVGKDAAKDFKKMTESMKGRKELNKLLNKPGK